MPAHKKAHSGGLFCANWTPEGGGLAYHSSSEGFYADSPNALLDATSIHLRGLPFIPKLEVCPRLGLHSPWSGNVDLRDVLNYLDEVATVINKLGHLHYLGLVSPIVPPVFGRILVGFANFEAKTGAYKMGSGIQEETLRAMLEAGAVREVLVSRHGDKWGLAIRLGGAGSRWLPVRSRREALRTWASLTAVGRFAEGQGIKGFAVEL